MARIIWTSDLEIGIPEIDQQHKQLVDYINELHDSRRNADRKKIAEVIDKTIEYTSLHFGFEETMLADAKYPLLRPHKKVHDLFVKRIADLSARFKSGEEVGEELQNLLGRWLVGHIKHDDYAYKECVKRYFKIEDRSEQTKTWWNRFFSF